MLKRGKIDPVDLFTSRAVCKSCAKSKQLFLKLF